ncbi:hypothetical protein [Bradyrhizobium archetypum]|uniref:Uncharacterized protein n=1 Tax=Bradyrhizobium archetypum TaxID=2721160 RepID=A0A7Y4M2F1_9BRAD|nr:hypothetical protein [Bradyrhizobium archetypum]NOJ46905.1 hypothetical protein [Bradyrhizobium archetypum]
MISILIKLRLHRGGENGLVVGACHRRGCNARVVRGMMLMTRMGLGCRRDERKHGQDHRHSDHSLYHPKEHHLPIIGRTPPQLQRFKVAVHTEQTAHPLLADGRLYPPSGAMGASRLRLNAYL